MVSLLPIYEVLKIETRIFAVSKHGIICLRFKSFETNIIFIHLHIFKFWILETNFIIIFHFLKSVFSGGHKGGYWGYLPPPLESWG